MNSYSTVLPPATVRLTPSSDPPDGASQCSSIVRPLASSRQQPLMNATSLVVAVFWACERKGHHDRCRQELK